MRKLLSQLFRFERTTSPIALHDHSAASASDAADRLIAEGNRAENEGDFRKACEQYRSAVDVAPAYSKAHLNLGIGLEAVGDVEGSIQSYETALAIDPGNPYASYNLGKLLYTRGALSRAEQLLHSALKYKPEFPEAQVALSNVYDSLGKLESALYALDAALKQRPDWAGALLNYGTVLRKLGRLTEAESALRQVVAIDPGSPDAIHDLTQLLCARGAMQDAEKLIRLALQHKPEFPDAYGALFHVYDSQGNLNAAAAALEVALKQRPDWAEALHNYGTVLKKLRRLTEAEAALRRAIEIAPAFSFTHLVLGAVLLSEGRIAEALEVFRVGRKLDPDGFDLESAELFTLNFSDDVSSNAIFERHRAFGARLEKAHSRRFAPFQNSREPDRRLRIGYVSGDFRSHPVALFMIPLLERHDRSAYQIYCYSAGTSADELTRQVQTRADIWREVAAISHTQLADTINSDGIDVLVDLSGHSGESRLVVFAQQPAPIQVTWLGYLSTTGMTRIQYRFCDRYTDPPGATEQLHTETLFRLPNSQWCYRPYFLVDYTCTGIAPFEKNQFVTFGSFNDASKLSPSVRKLWAEILTRVPDSRLVFVGVPDGHARDSLIQYFESAGIAPTRIAVLPRVALQEYFRWFNEVDIALDTTPYSGGTTTCDALWMEVPVITLAGTKSISRSTTGILSTIGLTEWIASTPEDYVRLAVEHAAEGNGLAKLRGTLRQRLRESPLMDEARFARDVEDAYRRMWRAWCGSAGE